MNFIELRKNKQKQKKLSKNLWSIDVSWKLQIEMTIYQKEVKVVFGPSMINFWFRKHWKAL